MLQRKQIRNDFMTSAIFAAILLHRHRCVAIQFFFCDSDQNKCVEIDKYLFLVSTTDWQK